jgi:hypothetical protein
VAAERFDAAELLRGACAASGVDLGKLIAATAIWAHPETHFRQLRQYGTAAVYPGIRRARPGQGEKRGVVNGCGLDDNSYANLVIKRALGMSRSVAVGFACCHIWPNSCYDARYHTAIANLVLVPAALAGLTDHIPTVQAALQYRAFELYQWHPDEEPAPVRPDDYPRNWRPPEPAAIDRVPSPRPGTGNQVLEGAVGTDRLRLWAAKPASNVHRIIALMCGQPMPRHELVAQIEAAGFSRDARGAIASLMTDAGNAYGRVFVEHAGVLHLHPDIADIVRRLWARPSDMILRPAPNSLWQTPPTGI